MGPDDGQFDTEGGSERIPLVIVYRRRGNDYRFVNAGNFLTKAFINILLSKDELALGDEIMIKNDSRTYAEFFTIEQLPSYRLAQQ